MRLFISPWTVQDHCKAIFEKIGTRSQRELRVRMFFQDHPGGPLIAFVVLGITDIMGQRGARGGQSEGPTESQRPNAEL